MISLFRSFRCCWLLKCLWHEFFFAFSGWQLYSKLEIIDLSAQRVLPNHFFLRIESTIWRPKSVLIKRAAKTIILQSCDVENCEYTSSILVEKGEILKKGRTYCVVGAPNDVSYKNNTHIPGISIHYFLKDVAVWPKWTDAFRSSTSRRFDSSM